MSFTDSGTFLAWDPLRPLKSPICTACGAAPAAPARCGGCKFAIFCGVECQRSCAAMHAEGCKAGYADYIRRLEQHTRDYAVRVQRRAGRLQWRPWVPRALNALGSEHRAWWLWAAPPCLLYTSPSPRDLSTSRMPSSA